LQARGESLLASRPIDRIRGGAALPPKLQEARLLAENCGRGGNASEQSFISLDLDLDCVLLLISPYVEGLAGSNKTVRNVSNDQTVFFVILRFVHERPFLSCLFGDEKKVTVQVLICMFDTLHRTRNASTGPLGHFMTDAMKMNVDNGAADDPQVPERRDREPIAMRMELVDEGMDGAC
jgi:hypothetical protein